MIDADFYTWLKAQSGITDICSTRIYALILPQMPTYPAITFTPEDGSRDRTYDGEGTLVPTDMQVDCWGETYDDARDLLAAFLTAIKNYTGAMGSSTISQVIIGAEINIYENQIMAYRTSVTVTIWNYSG